MLSKQHSNDTTASDTRQLSSSNSSPPSLNQDIESLTVAFPSDLDLSEPVRGGYTRIEYALLGLSLENVADRHPISYPPSFEDLLSEAAFGCQT